MLAEEEKLKLHIYRHNYDSQPVWLSRQAFLFQSADFLFETFRTLFSLRF